MARENTGELYDRQAKPWYKNLRKRGRYAQLIASSVPRLFVFRLPVRRGEGMVEGVPSLPWLQKILVLLLVHNVANGFAQIILSESQQPNYVINSTSSILPEFAELLNGLA